MKLLAWLSNPDNLVALAGVVVALLSLAKNVAQRLNLLRAATALGEAQATAAKTSEALVVLVGGVEKVKKTVGSLDAAQIAGILRDHATTAGVEHVVAPIVDAVQKGDAPLEVVRRVTGRL